MKELEEAATLPISSTVPTYKHRSWAWGLPPSFPKGESLDPHLEYLATAPTWLCTGLPQLHVTPSSGEGLGYTGRRKLEEGAHPDWVQTIQCGRLKVTHACVHPLLTHCSTSKRNKNASTPE